MADIKAFRALRPSPALAGRVAALPYDVMNEAEAREMLRKEPLSFVALDRPETLFPEGTVSSSSPEVYKRAAERLCEMKRDGILIKDDEEAVYIYREKDGAHVQTGAAALLKVEDYLSSKIKKHELTRPDKEDDRVRHIEALGAHTGPIFIMYRHSSAVRDVMERQTAKEPLYSFTDERGVENTVWRLTGKDKDELIDAFGGVDALYIADGHHRNAAAVRVALSEKERTGSFGESGSYLAVMVPDDEVEILDYNRVLSTLGGHSPQEILSLLKKDFRVEERPSAEAARPLRKHSFAMYMDSKWYSLECAVEVPSDPIESLDVSILEKKVLLPVFGITDERSDPSIDFVGGGRGPGELERRVDEGEALCAFRLYPTLAGDIMDVADAGGIMPPKSTWFEPKLLSGILIHEFRD